MPADEVERLVVAAQANPMTWNHRRRRL